MEPTLQAGQGLIGWRSTRTRVGQLRCLEHPERPGFWLVKRVDGIPSADTMTVRSDNSEVTTTDSRMFGAVPIDGSYRVVVKIPLSLM